MATDRAFVAYVVEQSQLGDALAVKPMFGEYGMSLDGRMIALLCDGSLFVKALPATDGLTGSLPRRSPYPGANVHAVADALLDDPDALRSLLQATARAVPAPKPKRVGAGAATAKAARSKRTTPSGHRDA